MNFAFHVGLAKEEMTCLLPGVGMMGYGQPHNKVKEKATCLWARALVLDDTSGKRIIIVHLEQAFVTLAIKDEILRGIQSRHPEWRIDDEDLLVSAQHTHSAPGGYSHYPLYNLTISHFQTKVFETVSQAALSAVEKAATDMKACTLEWGKVEIHPDKEVAFNRSMQAYLNNSDAPGIAQTDKSLGVNRTMEGMLIKGADGKLLAHLNWFGVHCTSVSSFNNRIHHDNKGVAAALFEQNHPGTVAFFFQHSAGDISPNFIWDKKIRLMRGKYADQYENAAYNAEIQFRESEKIAPTLMVSGSVNTQLCYVDMAKKVAAPAHGLAFFRGTLEGPGIPPHVAAFCKVTSRVRRFIDCLRSEECREFYKKHGAKEIVIDHRNGSFIGLPLRFWKAIPVIPTHPLTVFQGIAKLNALETLPWVPSIIPFQLLRLGNVLIVAVPGEITTMAGQRLKAAVTLELLGTGIDQVIIHSYSNAYMGYITTAEEYDKQAYEGGHNVYGRDTLDAVIVSYRALVRRMKGEACDLEKVMPLRFPVEELKLRSV